MKHTLFKSLAAAAVAGFLAAAPDAQAVFVLGLDDITGSGSGNDSAAELRRLTDKDCLDLVYKGDFDDGDTDEETDPPADPTLFDITWGDLDDDDEPHSALLDYTGSASSFFDLYEHAFLVVKAGPGFVYYDLSGWNGSDDISVTDAGIDKAISHISTYACEGTPTVPEGGASVALLGLALAGVGAARRFMKKA